MYNKIIDKGVGNMKLQELGRMPAKERLAWINTSKVQDLNAILKEVEIKGYSKMKKQEKIELIKELVAQEIRINKIFEGITIDK